MRSLLSVVGARPQFVKAAVLSRLIRGEFSSRFRECLVHTGQHYDENMSAVFFREMGIPDPDVNLGIGSGPHGRQTGEMLTRLEQVIQRECPDCVVVYGDTNSTLAAALAAAKLGVPVAHVEAGMRSFNRRMPEELNRVVTDHLSDILLCPTAVSRDNLAREGIDGAVVVGDVMFDARVYCGAVARAADRPARGLADRKLPEDFYLLTLHRAENTDDPRRLAAIVGAVNGLDQYRAVFPLHPRTRAALDRNQLSLGSHVTVIDPVGFLEMLRLEELCAFVVTDSGGVQKEAYYSRKPCITLREETEWVETTASGWNTLVGCDPRRISAAFRAVRTPQEWHPFYGDGRSGHAILECIEQKLAEKEGRT